MKSTCIICIILEISDVKGFWTNLHRFLADNAIANVIGFKIFDEKLYVCLVGDWEEVSRREGFPMNI